MKQEVLAKRYARALYETAADAALVEAALDRLSAALSRPEGRRLLLSPLVAAGEKQETARRLLADAVPEAAARAALGLWGVLIEHRREALLPDVREMFHQIRLREAGETPCEVVSARPLPAEESGRLVAALGRHLGRRLAPRFRVDPTVLGGVRVKVGDRLLDWTIAGSLAHLRRQLTPDDAQAR